VEEAVVVRLVRMLGNECRERRVEHVEDPRHLVRREPFLVVFEEDVVRIVVRREALEPLELELDDALEQRLEHREVARPACAYPDAESVGLRFGKPRGERRRDAAGALPVPTRDAHEAGVVRVRGQRGGVVRELVDELTDAVVDPARVYDPLERRQLRRPGRLAPGRHRHVEIPVEQRAGALEVVDLGEALLEFGQRFHP
jgi:hypothetical protein